MKKQINYPSTITFKSVFYHDLTLQETIAAILEGHDVIAQIRQVQSKNDKFVSFTITAEFPSESRLDEVCSRLTAVPGFVMMI